MRWTVPSQLQAAAVIASALLSLVGVGCGERPAPRPSVLLFVVDTLRADAVSAYGARQDTTPNLDALASRGVRYARAFAAAPWTLPSHASLFTGMGMEGHRVGTPGHLQLEEDVVTLAERFAAAGYETAAFSENMLVSDVFGQLQGFRWKRVTRVYRKDEGLPADVLWHLDLESGLDEWLAQRDPDRPFFLFVNVFDAHSPYTVRDENPWVPADSFRTEMEKYALHPEQRLCDALPDERDLEILEGLYLGDVAAADRKLARTLEQLAAAEPERPIIQVVTSDHGELFGERRLMGHEFSVRQAALHVPLVVTGAPGAQPGSVVEAPVSLVDVAPSLLAWAGLEPEPAHTGKPLPLAPTPAPEPDAGERPFFSGYSDAFFLDPKEWQGVVGFVSKDLPRRGCGPGDKVFGDMAALVRYPFKLQWFERYEPELYDLRWDPEERFDQAAQQPDRVRGLVAEMAPWLEAAGLGRHPEGRTGPDEKEIEALRALGYVDQ